MNDEITPEKIEQHYLAAMDSVNLLNAGKPQNMTEEEWADCVARNVGHLKIMLAKTFWTDQDLKPLEKASQLKV